MYKNVKTITLLLVFSLGCYTSIFSIENKLSKDKKTPNIIIILTDDQGYGDISAHGSPDVYTPNMDRLKSQSASLEDFHVSPTCAPSRSAIMSGRAPFKSGVTHTILERERMVLGITTLPEVLKRANYTTGIFGKWHLGDEKEYQPHNRGFDEVFTHGAGGIGQRYPGSCADVPQNKYQDPTFLHNNTFVKTEGFCTDVLFMQALSWMKSCSEKGKPFFTYLATNAPHGPFIAPESFKKKFADKNYPVKGQGYYGMVENIDYNLGILMEKLDKWKLTDNTILIFMSDNGRTSGPTNHKKEIYNAGMRGLKNTSYQGGTRVPFFIRWPKHIKAGSKINSLFSHYDILPTLAEAVNIPIQDIPLLDGESFLPYVKGEKTTPTEKYRFVHAARWPGKPSKYKGLENKKAKFKGNEENSKPENSKYIKCGVRSQQYNFVNNKELYDITKDPGEQNNIIDKHPELVAKMRKAYDAWWNSMLPYMVNEDETLLKKQPIVEQYKKQLEEKGIPKWKKPSLD